MPATDGALQTTSSEPATAYIPRGRDKLATLVVVGSFLTVFALAGTLIAIAQSGDKEAIETTKTVFTTILPVLAGWVGTVLAFYFSAQSQERASASLDKVINQGGLGGAGPSAQVSTKMLPYAKIGGLQDLGKTKPQIITIKGLQDEFNVTLPNGAKVTRLLFVENGTFKYVLHESTLNAFIVKNPDVTGKTFADMLVDEETLRQISKLVVFVSASATLGDAKAALDKVNGAQDIIVTGTGNSTEPMIGWLSNNDLTKAIQVN